MPAVLKRLLFVIFLPAEQRHGAVELLQQDNPRQFVGQSEPRESQLLLAAGEHFGRQAQRPADQQRDVPPQFQLLSQPSRQSRAIALFPRRRERNPQVRRPRRLQQDAPSRCKATASSTLPTMSLNSTRRTVT